jgi:hypothetical protein
MYENCASTLFVGVVLSAGSRGLARLSGVLGERDDAAAIAPGSADRSAAENAGRALLGDIEQQLCKQGDGLALLLGAQRYKPSRKQLELTAAAHASRARGYASSTVDERFNEDTSMGPMRVETARPNIARKRNDPPIYTKVLFRPRRGQRQARIYKIRARRRPALADPPPQHSKPKGAVG